jgi:TolB-like protein/Tfp pilus assembly protein PilF
LSRFRWLVQQARKRSLFQVLAVYAGGSWVVLQVVHTLSASLHLPDWFAPLAFILLLIGLPIVIATALVQEGGPDASSAPPASEASEARATDPPAAAEPRRLGRVLTWRNAIAGGVLAFALWGAAAAGWLLVGPRPDPADAASAPGRIVVLPFENLGREEDQHFADGMTEEVTARLARIGGLGVIARTSAVQYRDTRKSVAEIGEELAVDYLLEGTVRWEHRPDGSSRVRVTPQLIRVSDATHMWAEVYDEPLAGVFQVQSDIAQRVVDALGITLLDAERRSVHAAPTAVLEAYDFYLRGNTVRDQGATEENYSRAIALYERAVGLDSDFASAWARLSRMHSAMYWYHWDRSDERLARARQAAARAVDLAPELADGYDARGWYYYWAHLDYDRALEQFRRALELEPGNAEPLWGVAAVRRRQGRFDEATTAFEQAFQLDPRSSTIAQNIAQTHHLLREYAQAASHYQTAIRLTPADFGRPHGFLAHLHMEWTGDTRQARSFLDEAARHASAREEPFVVTARVLADMIDGEYDNAIAYLDSLQSQTFEEQFYFLPKAQLRAQLHDLLGQRDLAAAHYDSARIAIERELRARPLEDARLHSALGIALAGLGRAEEAIAAARLGVALLPMEREAWRGAYRVEDLARVYTMVGEPDLAIEQLERLLTRPNQLSATRLRLDPTWAPLRDHPRFRQLVDEP